MLPFLKSLLGDPTEKRLAQHFRDLEKVKEAEAHLTPELTDLEAVQTKTRSFMARFEGLDWKNDGDFSKIVEILKEIRFEAFATHRIACRLISGREFELEDGRKIVWNMVPYDVQIVGAMALHDRSIAEMKTGEGKTLVATIAAYLNALAGLPVHVVTVNDYLARRDAMEMGIVYGSLGLSTGVIVHSQSPDVKREQYRKNVVYATNNELGFDYLRDNMVPTKERRVMGPLFYAIIDEVDSILVDEARTPLIISAPDSEATTKYVKFAAIAKKLDEGRDYKIDEKQKTATLTEAGIGEIEKMLGIENIYVSAHYNDIHHIENALKANFVYRRDVDYLVRGDDVMIIDEHTGRVLAGRRYSDGLHQAIEAKENAKIQQESKTLASITFQNYFRLYKKLSGMTGTAKTEEEEFYKIYGLEVIVVPTNRPMIRKDQSDLLFKNEKGKYAYVVKLIKALHEKGQPLLVGTVSVSKSEYLSDLLTQAGVRHEVLNAKQDAREAEIIGQAGQFGSVTIATNMAGRGTDIKVAPEVAALSGKVTVGEQTYDLGGLYVIGTEKHETRRIDNQLRGRSGRQGDPGLSQFLVSPQDDIMRIFGGDRIFGLFNSPLFASIPEDEPLAESKSLTNRITGVQKQVEGRNFDIRKHILEYDDVLNHHRLVIYGRRNRILELDGVHDEVERAFAELSKRFVEESKNDSDEIDAEILIERTTEFAGYETLREEDITDLDEEILADTVRNAFFRALEPKMAEFPEAFADYEKRLMLQSIDELWMRHIDEMAHLKEEVAFEGFAQKQPLVVYKERAYEKFVSLVSEIGYKVCKGLLTASAKEPIETVEIDESKLEAAFADLSQGNADGIMNLLSDEAIMKAAVNARSQDDEGVRVIRADSGSNAP
jgi:preprotein translocase subunit SecA